MLLISLLTLTVFVMGALAAPLNPVFTSTTSLIKRVDPAISTSFSAQEVEQIGRGFHDALQLANAVVYMAKHDSGFNKVFSKYFDIKDLQLVLSVFEKILDNDKTKGNGLLGDIRVVVDYKDDDNDFGCDHGTMAETRQTANPARPEIVVCKSALKYGAIEYKFKGVSDIDCSTLGSRVSWHMDTLGSIFLHEYTHWNHFISPLFSNQKGNVIIDDPTIGYGPVAVAKLAKKSPEKARYNADSYSWLANRVFWTAHCGKKFNAASKTMRDDHDPYFNR